MLNKLFDKKRKCASTLLSPRRPAGAGRIRSAPRPPYGELNSVDWSFTDRRNGHAVEAIHPYPAKFIPDIPRALLSALHVPNGTAVLDLFCGSGTTLTEAQRLGLPSVGIDLNPIACLISRVKTAPTPLNFEQVAAGIAGAALISLLAPNLPIAIDVSV